MAGKSDAILIVGADTKSAEANIQAMFNRVQKTASNLRIGNTGGPNGLGSITRDFQVFEKSVDAAFSRVAAFGLAAGAVVSVQRAFSSLVRETIAVDKAFKEINVIFGLSSKSLTSFGAELFKISRDTGQNFSAVAEAAKELSRQGLNVSDTLQRTKDSLILVRQSGLDAESSVKAITVALNSFTREALSSSDVVNKLAAVDSRYAVSSADLAEALSRVGSTASEARVSFNELLGTVTAIQQITGRSGQVIGNSLKSIFTRTVRGDVIDQLRELGVAISSQQSGIEKLQALSNALKTATPEVANTIKELAGGVYQINAVSAALGDLGSNYSITARATRDAANASNEAYTRNEQLNKSYDTLINRTSTNLKQVGSSVGNLTVGPALERILGTLNSVLESAVSKDSNNAGEIMAKGLISGFGQFVSGPGLAVVVVAIGKLLARFTGEAITGFKTLLGMNEAAKQRASIEMVVTNALKGQPELIALANQGYNGQLQIIQKINAALSTTIAESQAIKAVTSTYIASNPRVTSVRRSSGGSVPNFANTNISPAVNRELASGLNLSQIKIGKSPVLASSSNPLGLGVYNTRDEPGGINQGINRAFREGRNPKTYGVPNFALNELQKGDGVNYGGKVRIVADRIPHPQVKGQFVISFADDPKKYIFERDVLKIPKGVTAASVANQVSSPSSIVSGHSPTTRSPSSSVSSGYLAPYLFGKDVATATGKYGKINETLSKINQNVQNTGLTDSPTINALKANLSKLAKAAGLNAAELETLKTINQQNIVAGRKAYEASLQYARSTTTNQNPPLTRGRQGTYPNQVSAPNAPFPVTSAALNTAASAANQRYPSQQLSPTLPPPPNTAAAAANRRYPPPGYPNPIGPTMPYPPRQLPSPQFVVAAPRQSLYSRSYNAADNFIKRPGFQNAALAGSFVIPTLAGGIAEGFDKNTIEGRGRAQAVQSSANALSYGLLGSQFGGPYGAIGGLALGGLLEAPRVIKAFTDKIPDLNREIERLTERINQTNDGFSNIIQSNEKLAAYNRGELDLNQSQVVGLNKGRSQQISQLSLLFPEFAKDIRRVSYGNNINDIQEIAGNINDRQIKEKRLLEGDRLSRTIVPQSDFEKILNRYVKPYFGHQLNQLANAPSLLSRERREQFIQSNGANPFEAIFKASYGTLKPDEKENLLAQFQNTFLETSNSKQYKNKTLTDILVGEAQSGDTNRLTLFKKLLNIQPKENEVAGFSKNLGKALSLLPKGNAEFNYQSFADTYAGAKPNERAFLTDRLKEFIDSIFDQASVQDPNNARKVSQDFSELIKSFFNLRRELDLFTGRLEIITNSDLANVQRTLELNLSNAQTSNNIKTGRIQPFSPFGAIESQRIGDIQENELNTNARISALKIKQSSIDRGLPANIFTGLQELAGDRAKKDDIDYGQTLKKYNEVFAGTLKGILPAYQGYGEEPGNIDPQSAIKAFFKNASPNELDSFYENINTVRDKLFTDLGNSSGKSEKDAIRGVLDVYEKALNNRTLSKETNAADIANVLESSANNLIIINNKAKEAKQGFINGLLQQDADIIENVKEYTNNLNKIYEKYNLQNPNFRQLRGAQLETSLNRLDTARQQYAAGNIGARELQPFTSDAARKQLRNDGSISRESLNDIFKSSFGYNKQDFGQDLISDMEGIRDALTSIRPAAKDAFASMVDGSKSAGDAFRDFGTSMATNVLNNVAKLAFDNVFGNLFNNNTFGAIGNLFSAKSKGGIVGYASGGMVTGGSGIRDDVPAMLANGAYVIKKSSVNKYGSGFLSSLNSGRGFASGGINQILRNDFSITGRKQGIRGSFDIDPRLSVIGQTDENNPSNLSKFGREQDYYGYLNTIEDYKRAVKQFEAAKTQRLIGAYTSGIINIGAAGLSSFRNSPGPGRNPQSKKDFYNAAGQEPATYGGDYFNGGLIRRYAGGGSVDSIPALLTSGEFVMSPQAVNRMGVGFMNRLNGGQVSPSRYASGGFVGRDINATSPVSQDNSDWGQINSSLLELIKLNQEIRDLSNGTKSKVDNKNAQNNNTDNSTAISPSVSITVNVMGDKTNTQTQSNNTENSNNGQNMKQFAELMKNTALDVIVSQMRQGGLLSNSVRK